MMSIKGNKRRRAITLTKSVAVMTMIILAIAGCSVAQLQAGLETPTEIAILTAEKNSRAADIPTAIKEYPKFSVPVTSDLSLSVYARESDNATANVLLVHGAGGGAWAWEYYFEHLPSRYNVYALSWRGHFDSAPVNDANAKDYVVDQEAVLTAIKIRKDLPTHIVGHSYGGATSVLQVARSETDIASLVLLAPVVPLDYTLAQRLIVPTVAPYFIRKSSKKGNDKAGTFGGMFLSKGRMQRYHELYAKHDYAKEKLGLIAGDGVSSKWQDELSDAYAKVASRSIPVTIFVARYDNVIVPRRQRETAKRIGAELIEVESGHYLPLAAGTVGIIKQVVEKLSK